MNCDEATGRFLAGEADGGVREHVASCPTCAASASSLEATRSVLDADETWAEPPAALEEQVVALVSASPPEAGRGRTGWWWGALAGAAAVLVVVGAWAFLAPDAPDWEVAMPGTDLAPQASSTVAGWNTEHGTVMRLEVDGLGPAPVGTVYELWLSSDSAHISAGTFVADGEIELTTGVRRADYPRLWVTVEPVDGEGGPSGRTVLDTGT